MPPYCSCSVIQCLEDVAVQFDSNSKQRVFRQNIRCSLLVRCNARMRSAENATQWALCFYVEIIWHFLVSWALQCVKWLYTSMIITEAWMISHEQYGDMLMLFTYVGVQGYRRHPLDEILSAPGSQDQLCGLSTYINSFKWWVVNGWYRNFGWTGPQISYNTVFANTKFSCSVLAVRLRCSKSHK